jgi:hypothetical protein
MADSFIVYKSFQKAIDKLPDDMQLGAYKALMAYGLDGAEYEGDNFVIAALLEAFMANIDKAQSRRETAQSNGKQGGAPKGNQNAKKNNQNNLKNNSVDLNNQENNQNNLNVNVNDNVNDNVNVNVNELKDSCTELSAQSAAISMPLNDGSEYPVFDNAIKEWEKLYPAVDVMQELRNMRGWLMSNPTRRKTKAGIKRFITGWLAKEQNKGRSAPMRAAPKSPQDNFPATKRDWSYLVE